MAKRKVLASSDDGEYDDDAPARATSSESPERPLQTARRTGKKAKKASPNVSDDESDEETLWSIKKPKVAKPSSIKKPKMFAANPPNDDTGDAKIGVNERGERFIELGKKRRATVNTFKGGKYLDIREYYGDESDLKPGKKGISITLEQWETLKKNADAIDSFFAKLK